MFFSKPCQHAIRALVHLVLHQGDTLCNTQEIARSEDLPAPALAAVLQNLVRAGLVRSQKGPKGGFTLARPATELTLLQVVEAVDTKRELYTCAIGFETCSDTMPCPVHERLSAVRQEFMTYLQEFTLADMAVSAAEKKRRVASNEISIA